MKCLICQSECHSFVDRGQNVGYYSCDRCQAIFKSPSHFEDFSEQKKRYDLHQNSAQSAGYRAYFGRFLSFVLPVANQARSALDFGSGVSFLLADMLKEEGIDCDSYDPIYHPQKDYQQKSYDLIVSVEVFEHLQDPKGVFEHLLSRIDKGGYFAIQTQFHYGDIDRFLDWHYRLDPTHIIFFVPETLRYLADLYGCKYVADNGKNIVIVQKSE